jgi:hypothetical protein
MTFIRYVADVWLDGSRSPTSLRAAGFVKGAVYVAAARRTPRQADPARPEVPQLPRRVRRRAAQEGHVGQVGAAVRPGAGRLLHRQRHRGRLNTAPFHLYRQRRLTEADAVTIYALATKLDPFPGTYPPDDTGSSGLAACKAAQRLGYISAYHHAFGIEHALRALQLGPVITGIDWYSSFDRPDSNGQIRIAGDVRGGHEVEVYGYDPVTDFGLVLELLGPHLRPARKSLHDLPHLVGAAAEPG